MQLLGIEITGESPVNRILAPGWYPFGSFRKPDIYGFVRRRKAVPREIEDIYTAGRPEMPHISVAAIVGMNGSGKSSLIEILFRIINNFTRTLLGKTRSETQGRHLEYANNLFANLHFSIDGVQYRISCSNIEVELHRIVWGQKPLYFHIKGKQIFEMEKIRNLLHDMFYTIVTNYSLYAYNVREYQYETENATNKAAKGGSWLNGLFHKNDAYFTPMVITPFRRDGRIDIDNEAKLSIQRIVKLAILADVNKKNLIPGYRPNYITVSFNDHFQEQKLKRLRELFSYLAGFLQGQEPHFINELEKAWKTRLKIKGNVNKDRRLSSAIFYLAYKSVKLAVMHPDYMKILKISGRDRVRESGFIEYVEQDLPSYASKLVEKILSDFNKAGEHNHLSLKIEQTYNFVVEYLATGKFRWDHGDRISVKDIVNGQTPRHFSDLAAILPPPIFEIDIKFRRDRRRKVKSSWNIFDNDELSVAQMSSGERQFLNAISYVLYHIKNLESVQPDDDRVQYRHICLIFDEMELYFHPDYQRSFISRLLESLEWCNIDPKRIKSIQILLITHSPFVLSDVFTHNTLYLDREGKPCSVDSETFGANYYTMLSKSFFFTQSATGEESTRFIGGLVKKAKKRGENISALLPYVGDDFLRNYIKSLQK